MKLDRNINSGRQGKYALINLRKTQLAEMSPMVMSALVTLQQARVLQWGNETPEDQFFVLKYKDLFAADALLGYALSVKEFAERGLGDNRMTPAEFDHWMEWHKEILVEAERAKLCIHKLPD